MVGDARKVNKKTFVLYGRVAASLRDTCPVNAEMCAVHGLLRGQVKPLHTPSSVVGDCRTKHRAEDVSKTRVQSGKRMGNSSIKLTKVVCSWTLGICHDTKRFLVQLIIRKEKSSSSGEALLSSPIKTIKRRLVIPSTSVSVFSLLYFLFIFFLSVALPCESWCAENVARLRFAQGNMPFPRRADLQVLDRVEATVDGTSADTQTLCWDSTLKIVKHT